MTDLIARLETADKGSRELDYLIHEYLGWQDHDECGWSRGEEVTGSDWPHYTTSLDAADTLRDAGRYPILIVQHLGPIMGCGVRIGVFDTSDGEARPAMFDASAKTEPLARCAAALKARA